MPAWIHDRAHHIMGDNPSMKKSTAFAIATQQSHATGNTPKSYGTPTGKAKAKRKYDEPRKMKQTADPSHKGKSASVDLARWMGFVDELEKIAISTKPAQIAAMGRSKLAARPRAVSVPREPPEPASPLDLMRHSHTSTPPLTTSAG